MIVNLSIIAACFGRYSHSATPGSLVPIVPNGPRISGGACGLTSQVSMWLGPPVIHNRITLLRPGSGRPVSAAWLRRATSRPATDLPMPARLALSTLRRLTTRKPSCCRALRKEKAEAGRRLEAGGGRAETKQSRSTDGGRGDFMTAVILAVAGSSTKLVDGPIHSASSSLQPAASGLGPLLQNRDLPRVIQVMLHNTVQRRVNRGHAVHDPLREPRFVELGNLGQ